MAISGFLRGGVGFGNDGGKGGGVGWKWAAGLLLGK